MRAVFLFACACVNHLNLLVGLEFPLVCEHCMIESYRLAPRPIAMQIEALFSKAGEGNGPVWDIQVELALN